MTRASLRIRHPPQNDVMDVVQLDAALRLVAPEIPLAFSNTGIKTFNALFTDMQSTLAHNSV
jgi:hypothetical protein